MASITINSGSSAWAIGDGDALSHVVTGYYCVAIEIAPRKYEVEEIASNGVDGYGTKLYGARAGSITARVCAVRSTATGCVSGLHDQIYDHTSSGAIVVSAFGLSWIARIGDPCTIEHPRNTGLGTYRADATITLHLLRNAT